MSQDDFDDLLASVDSALIVVTTAVEGERAGCLVGFHSQASMSPQQYSFCLSKANHTYRVGLRAIHFALHFLTAEDRAMAQRFGARSGEDTDKFRGLDVTTAAEGVPVLTGVPNRLIVERLTMLDDGGDHVGITARVISTEVTGPFAPLRLSQVRDLPAGRDNEDRAIQP